MDHADVFVYMGGEVPDDVPHVRVHKSVKITITQYAFRHSLVSIEMHDGVEIIKNDAFYGCLALRRIKLSSVSVIEENAFYECWALEDVEFGDKLEIIE